MSVSAALAWIDGPTPDVWSDGHRRRIELGWRAASHLTRRRDMRWWANLVRDVWGQP